MPSVRHIQPDLQRGCPPAARLRPRRGVGIAFSYATALKSVFLVRSTRRTLMLAAINSLFDSSALVPLLLNILQRAGLATTGSLFAAHSVLLAVVFSLLSVGWMALLGGCRSDVADAGGTKSNIESSYARGESGSDPRWSLSLREILRERDYRCLGFFTAIHIFRLNLYFGSVSQTLESLGDDDNFYALVFAASQPPLQILLSWPVSTIVVRLGHRRALMLTVVCCALHGGLALMPALLLQPVTFLSVAIYRVLFCMPHTARTSNYQVCYTHACSGVALDRFSGPRPARTNVGSNPLKHASGNAISVRWCSVHRDLPARHAHQHGARWQLDRSKCGDSRVCIGRITVRAALPQHRRDVNTVGVPVNSLVSVPFRANTSICLPGGSDPDRKDQHLRPAAPRA